ncbi:unnamed protein product, partial [Didymodactylos carnosus]
YFPESSSSITLLIPTFGDQYPFIEYLKSNLEEYFEEEISQNELEMRKDETDEKREMSINTLREEEQLERTMALNGRIKTRMTKKTELSPQPEDVSSSLISEPKSAIEERKREEEVYHPKTIGETYDFRENLSQAEEDGIKQILDQMTETERDLLKENVRRARDNIVAWLNRTIQNNKLQAISTANIENLEQELNDESKKTIT